MATEWSCVPPPRRRSRPRKKRPATVRTRSGDRNHTPMLQKRTITRRDHAVAKMTNINLQNFSPPSWRGFAFQAEVQGQREALEKLCEIAADSRSGTANDPRVKTPFLKHLTAILGPIPDYYTFSNPDVLYRPLEWARKVLIDEVPMSDIGYLDVPGTFIMGLKMALESMRMWPTSSVRRFNRRYKEPVVS